MESRHRSHAADWGEPVWEEGGGRRGSQAPRYPAESEEPRKCSTLGSPVSTTTAPRLDWSRTLAPLESGEKQRGGALCCWPDSQPEQPVTRLPGLSKRPAFIRCAGDSAQDSAAPSLPTITKGKTGANTPPATSRPRPAGTEEALYPGGQGKPQTPTHGPEEPSASGVLTAPKNATPVPKLTAAGMTLNFPAW